MRQSVPATIGVVFAALLALGGLAVSGILLQHHIVVEIGGDPVLGGLCKDVGGQSSCDAALRSHWGKMVLGKHEPKTVIPTAMFGFVFFACMASWYLVVGRAGGSRRGLHVLPVIGSAVGALVCVWLDVIMWAKLPEPCWFCFTTHVLTWALLLVTLLLWPRRGAAAGPVVAPAAGVLHTSYGGRSEMAHPPMHLVLAAVLLAVATSVAGWGVYKYRLKKDYADQYYAKWQEYDKDYAAKYEKFMLLPQFDIPIMPEDPVRGPVNAPHTVVTFTDFQCPYCKLAASMLEERMAEFPGKFRVVFKYFPMNTTCNDYVKSTLYKGSCAAAVSAEAARILGGQEMFWKMYDELFRDPEGFGKSPENYVKQACQKLGLDNDAIWRQINTRAIWDRIRVNAGQGNALDIRATPTLFFDGRRMSGWGDRHDWRFLVEGPAPAATRPAAGWPVTTQPRPTVRTQAAGAGSRPAAAIIPTAPRPQTAPAATKPGI